MNIIMVADLCMWEGHNPPFSTSLSCIVEYLHAGLTEHHKKCEGSKLYYTPM